MKISLSKKINFDTILISLVVFYPELYKYIWWVFNRITSIVGIGISGLLVHAIVWFPFLFYYHADFIKRIKLCDVISFMTISFVMLLFYAFADHYKFSTDRLINFIFRVLPFYFVGRIYRCDDERASVLFPLATVTLVMSYIYTVFFVIPQGNLIEGGNMHAAYQILPSILFLLFGFFVKGKCIYGLVGIFGIMYLLMLGTRGPLLCVLIFFILILLKKVSMGKLVAVCCACIMALGIFISSPAFDRAFISLNNTTEALGFSTRIFEKMEEDEMTTTSGRDVIYQRVIESIKENPYAMPGPYSDWKVIGRYRDPENPHTGNYSPNVLWIVNSTTKLSMQDNCELCICYLC